LKYRLNSDPFFRECKFQVEDEQPQASPVRCGLASTPGHGTTGSPNRPQGPAGIPALPAPRMAAAANAVVLPSGRDPGTRSTHGDNCALSENHPTPRQQGYRAPGPDQQSGGCSQCACGNQGTPGEVSQISGNSNERADAYHQEQSARR
jgi:hypothetical protein